VILFFALEMEAKVLTVDFGAAAGDAADDLKFISGLSTILVATIQEVKDQVSQVEFVFCKQLFPHIQAKAKLDQARFDAMKANEDEWRKREASLVSQLEELSSWKRQAEERLLQMGRSVEEMKGKLVDSERLAGKHEAEKEQMEGVAADVVAQLKREINEKAAEVAKEREAHQRLLQQVELKDKDLLLEQSKRKDLIEDFTQLKTNFKHLKSQYNFLLGKIDQNDGSKSHVDIPVNRRNSESPPSKRKLKGTVI
jgi:DNA repair exonuclease SbcCD ATPase subunit